MMFPIIDKYFGTHNSIICAHSRRYMLIVVFFDKRPWKTNIEFRKFTGNSLQSTALHLQYTNLYVSNGEGSAAVEKEPTRL